MSKYFLPEGYVERLGAPQSYDVGETDHWQDEVYKEASVLAGVLGLQTVVDVGCGSGFKLMKYFGKFSTLAIDLECKCSTLGIDLEPAVKRLRNNYPDQSWSSVLTVDRSPDLLICSDVLEHLDDPDAMLATFKAISPKWLVISTPDRDLMARHPKWGRKMGPPSNGCHVREWAFAEFRQYMDSHHFRVVRHFHSNIEQATQCVIIDHCCRGSA